MGSDNRDATPLPPVDWAGQIESLARGTCSEEAFMAELWLHAEASPELPWSVAALLDKAYRAGSLRADLFRSAASHIARRQLTAERKVPLSLINSAHSVATTVPTPLTGETFPRKQQLAVGDVLRDRYVIDSCLGSGGMGTVYKAVDLFRKEHGEIDCHVAIKVLHEGTHERPAALARLRCEFYCAQMLSHPNIINVFELDRDGEHDIFTMEWLDGELLSSVLQQFSGKPMPRVAAWSIIRQIAEGIAHAHERNIVHADLKPQNIMILRSGQVRILDFGASSGGPRGVDAEPPRSQLPLTPAYASCELLMGKHPDRRDDLYALACLAFELLAGQHPFWHQRSTAARMAQAVPTRPPHLSDRQWKALLQGLSWDREHRSIPVVDWLANLNPQSVVLHAIPRPHEDEQAPSAPAKLSMARIMGALGVFFVCLGAWALFNRTERMDMAGMMATSASRIADTANAAPAPDAPDAPQPPVDAVRAASPAAPEAEDAPRAAPPKDSDTHRPAAAHAVRSIELAAPSYRVTPGANFVEVKVRRASATEQSSFQWWTESATALSGIDYVPQLPAKVTFERGSKTATLFVKLLSDNARKQTAKFDVVIGDVSKGSVVGLARAQVLLAPVVVATASATQVPPIT